MNLKYETSSNHVIPMEGWLMSSILSGCPGEETIAGSLLNKIWQQKSIVACQPCYSTSSLSGSALDYNIDVKPILFDKCFAYHGPDMAKQYEPFLTYTSYPFFLLRLIYNRWYSVGNSLHDRVKN